MKTIKSSEVSLQWLVFLACVVWLPSLRAFQAPTDRPPLPDYDKREPVAASQATPTPQRASALNALSRQVAKVSVDFDGLTGGPKWVHAADGFLSGAGGEGGAISARSLAALPANDPNRVVKAFLNEQSNLFGYGAEALDSARVVRDFVTDHNAMHTLVWEQQLDGIPVFEGIFVAHTTKREELVSVSSGFVRDLIAAANKGTPRRLVAGPKPVISAEQAVIYASLDVGEKVGPDQVAATGQPVGETAREQLTAPGLDDIGVQLTWLPLDETSLRLCWDVVLTSRARGEMFRVLVDAETGTALVRRCLTEYISDASFRVYTSDSPTPFSPGYSTPQTGQPATVPRLLVTLPALNTNASPIGWINDGGSETLGNNVDAHTDRNGDNVADLPRPTGTSFRVFDYPLDLAQAPSTYTNASVVQLFYTCNWMHDKLYELGFTEAAGNFQSNNFGRGGLGLDALQADAQDGSGTDNANMSTPSDGSAPRMQMYLFTGPTPDTDGDLDSEVVLHEYTHGLSNRRVGGGVGLSALQSRGMGEGWSDFYAMTLLSESGDNVDGVYASGAYASYLLSGLTQNYYFGIRRYPYCTDMTKNPLTFNDIDPAQANNCSSGAPYNPIFGTCSGSNASEVHNTGEVWCMTLWEARAKLIQKYGWAIGNQLILQLVTDGMNLSPANPTFVQARDAILQADLVDTGGANRADLWAAFAKRGLGANASSPSSSTTSGVVESFDPPDDLAISPGSGLTAVGPVGGPFTPNTLTYALTNAGSNTITWRAAKTAAWFDLSQTSGILTVGGPASSCVVSLNSLADSQPLGVYSATVWFTNVTSGIVQSRSIVLRSGQLDYFTQLFDTEPNDLDYQTFTFTPNGSPHFYSACREIAAAFPTDPTGGTVLSLSDDSYAMVTLSGTNEVSLYGRSTNVFFVGSNGYITFGSGDSSLSGSLSTHFGLRRISALFDDLYPAANVSWRQMSNRVAVTFQNVREFGYSNTNSFQVEMFNDGTIRLTYLRIDANYGLAGLSQGLGTPANFLESDLTAYGSCQVPLTLIIPPSSTEGNGVLTNAGRIILPSAATTDLTVTLSSSDTSEVTVPASVTILAGQTNASFDLTVVDDAVLDGTQITSISAATTGFVTAQTNIAIYDNETASLQVSLAGPLMEGQGGVAGIVLVSSAPAANVTVSLTSSDTSEVQVPASVSIASGQTSAAFVATVVDDNEIDGSQPATITAHVQNWTDGATNLTVMDNETTQLTVVLPAYAREGDGTIGNGGSVCLAGTLATNLVVALTSGDISELTVPSSATIPSGQTCANFNLTVVDDPDLDGAQIVQVTASAAGFTNGASSMTIYDNESPPVPFNPSPAQLATNVIQTADLSWLSGAVAGEVITNDVYFGTNPSPGAGELLGSTTGTNWILPTLAPLTTYYWQIVARKAGVTAGPVWRFTTRGVDHFDWSFVPSPQSVGTPFAASITARDVFGVTVSNFTESVSIQGFSGTSGSASSLVIAELDTDETDAVEFANASGQPLDISGWQIVVYDWYSWPSPDMTFTIPTNTICPVGGVFQLTESSPYPGTYPVFNTGTNIYWNNTLSDNPVALLLRDRNGNIVDFVCAVDAVPSQITTPVSIPTNQWSGSPVAGNSIETLTYQRVGIADNQGSVDWLVATPSPGQVNSNLTLPFTGGSRTVAVSPTNTSLCAAFTNGTWSCNITVQEPATNVSLVATDAAGHRGTSTNFDVLLANDISVSLVDQPDPLAVGARLTNTITVVNSGPNPATGITATNFLPASALFVLATASQGNCVPVGNRVECNLGPLAGGAGATVQVVTIPTTAGMITNLVSVGRAESDAFAGNNTAAAITTVQMPMLRIADAAVLEGNSGTSAAAFSVLLWPASPTNVTVNFATADLTAQAGSDYVSTNGSLSFAPGETNKIISVSVIGDTTGEPDETFAVTLSGAVNAGVEDATGIGTIYNDDLPPFAYLRSTVGAPWGSTSNEFEMSRVFGAGNWQDLRYETVSTASLFSPATRFIFMEGSDYNAIELQGFLTTNRAAVENWVSAGGRLFLNAAPNEGAGMDFGFGVTLLYPDSSSTGNAALPQHPIFQGPFTPVGTTWTGGSFGHATVSGTNLTAVITNPTTGRILLGERAFGSGLVMFGGMTTDNYHSPQPQAGNLRANIINYLASYVVCTNCPPEISGQPADQVASVGGSATLSVFATGSAPLSYQWRKNGTNIAGALNSSYALATVQTNDAGVYSVVVSNAFGLATSSNATLTVVYTSTADAFNPVVNGVVYCTTVQPDGKILLGGSFTTLGGQTRYYLGRVNADGTVDFSFNPVANGSVYALSLQPDGKILVGGSFNTLGGLNRGYLGRLNADGTVDSSFNPGANSSVYALTIQPDGKILVGGTFSILGSTNRSYLGRLNADGTVESTFNPGASSSVYTLALQSDGKILAGGNFGTLGGYSRGYIGRLNADGSVDTAFNPIANSSVYALALQADGKILAGGIFTTLGGYTRNYIGRLNTNGTADLTFNPGANGSVYSLVLEAGGKILVGGSFTSLGGYSRSYLGRLNLGGTTDVSFDPGAGSSVYSLALQRDGKVLVGGYFTLLGGQSRSYLGRVTATEPATESFSSIGSTITWLRSGSSPEVGWTKFSASTNGRDWTQLGSGTRVAGGWQVSGASLPTNSTLLAQGMVSGGFSDGSTWPVETVTGPPAILTQPIGRTVAPGTNVTLTVLAKGAESMSYQWTRNGVALVDGARTSGATNAVLALSNVIEADSALYAVAVSNVFGSVTSSNAALLVSPVDHFGWSVVSLPQALDTPFGVTISALDVSNRLATNFAGIVGLTARATGNVVTNTVGTNSGTSSSYPMYSYYPVQRSQAIYPASELGGAGRITALALDVSTAPGVMNSWTIRLKHTALSQYTSYVWESSDWTTVCQTNLSNLSTGWVVFPLSAPFDYDGVNNLMVDFSYYNTAYGSNYGYCNITYRGVISTIYYYTSTTYGNPLTWSGSSPSPYTSSYTPNLKLIRNDLVALPMLPVVSGSFSNGVWTGNVRVQQPATNVILTADDGSGHVGSSNPFNVVVPNDLSLSLIDSPDPVPAGANLTYTLTAANTGPNPATGVRVVDQLPSLVNFISANSSQGSCTLSNNAVICNLGTLTGGASATITIVVTPTVANTILTNLATASRTETDPYPGNNSAVAITTVTLPSLSIASASVVEGNVGTTNLNFTVSLSAASQQTVSVAYATANYTATAGVDYVATNGVLSFPPGTTNRTVSVPVIGDIAVESTETLYVNLSSPVNAVIGNSQAVGSILNDDGIAGQIYSLQWSNIASPQRVGTPFNVTLTARDVSGYQVYGFNGIVALSGRTGVGTTTITSNTSTTTSYPMNTYYHKERTQVIYPASELDGPGPITALALDVASLPSPVQPLNNWTIRLRHTPLSGYTNYVWETTNWTVVCQTNLTLSSTGWVTLPFNAPFYYNGTNSLMVDLSFSNTTYTSYTYCRSTLRSGVRTLYYYVLGSSYGDPLIWSNSVPYPYASTYVPNLRLTRGDVSPVAVEPAQTGQFTNGIWSGRIVVHELATNVVLVADDLNGHTGQSGAFNLIVSDDLAVSITDSPNPVTFGTNVSYLITVTNTGPSAASGVMLTNILPASARFVSANCSQGQVLLNPLPSVGGRILCDLGVLAGASRATVTIVATPTLAGLTLSNLVTVTRSGTDADPANNSAVALTTVSPPSLSIMDAAATEGDFGVRNLVFPVVLNAPPAQSVTLDYSITNGTALQNYDFVAMSGTLVIPAGLTNAGISVAMLGDKTVEPDESLFVKAGGVTGAVLSRAEATGMILNDDGLPGLVDHFRLGNVPSPQFTNLPFGLSITAEDVFGGLATNFDGTVNLGAPPTAGNEVFRADFETGLQGFVIDNTAGSGNGLWHLSTASRSLPLIGFPSRVSLYYGQNEAGGVGNYDNGVANGGAVVSPAILLPAATTLTLSLSYWMTVESGTNYDRAFVEISTNGGTSYLPLAVKGAPGGLTNITGNTWFNYSTNITAHAGKTVRLRFRFDTMDPVANGTEGWFVDNIVISRQGLLPLNNSFTVVPSQSGVFTNGYWSGDVAVLQPFSHATLVVDDRAGHTGVGNPFDVLVPVDVSVDLAASPEPVFTSSNLTYSVSVTNHGDVPATGVTLTNHLPDNVVLNQVVPSQGNFILNGGVVVCALGSLAPGGVATVNIEVTPLSLGGLTNLVEVGAAEADPFLQNNTAMALTEVVNNPPLLAGLADRLTDEDVPAIVSIAIGDVETPVDALVLDVTSSDTNLVGATGIELSGSGGSRTLALTPEPNRSGTTLITVTVTDAQAASTTKSFLLTVTPVNDAPVIAAIPAQTIVEETPLSFMAVAMDVDDPPNAFTFHLDDTAPVGAVLDPDSGAFVWTPDESQGPATNWIHIIATDDGIPAMSSTQTVMIVVLESNRPPVLPALADRVICEESQLTFAAGATDADLPPNPLTYSLGAGAPAGASINSTSGVFTWTPTELQGSTTNLIAIMVADNGVPSLTATQSFNVIVLESNRAPVLAAMADCMASAGSTCTIKASATDSDVPVNRLTYSFGAGAPTGALINATNGTITWTPPRAWSGSNYVINVRVTDDGTPVLSDTKPVVVHIIPGALIESIKIEGRYATVSWAAEPGKFYTLQYRKSFTSGSWINVGSVMATSPHASLKDDLGADPNHRDNQRIYRIVLRL